MSGTRKPRTKMQIGPLTTSAPSTLPAPPSLIGGFTSTQFQSQQRELSVEVIQPRRNQPRRTFSPDSLDQMTQSVRTHGILQPLSVHLRNGQYELIAGERRLRAARAAGLSEVPVRVFEGMSDAQIQQLAALENLQREDLNPVDEADAIMDILSAELQIPRTLLTAKLERWKSVKMRGPGYPLATADELHGIQEMDRLFPGLSRGAWTSFVANRLPVLRLPEALLKAVRAGELEYTKAVAIRSAPTEHHEQLLEKAGKLSILELRKTIRGLKATADDQEPLERLDAELTPLRARLTAKKVGSLSKKDQARVLELLREVEQILLQGD